MTEKLIRDALGDAVPQLQNEDGTFSALANGDPVGVDFGKKKLLRDALGTPLPMQYYDVELGKFVAGSLGGGEGGSATWSTIAGKPSQFPPSSHPHEISDINGLKEELNKVFTQVSSGKSLLETSILNKGGNVGKVEEVPTFEELQKGITAIPVSVTGGGTGGIVEKKYFSDEHPLPIDSTLFTSAEGYVIVKVSNDIRLYAINGYMKYDISDNTYSPTKRSWVRWNLINNKWVYTSQETTAFLGSAVFITENFIELSHHAMRDKFVTFEGKLGYYEWFDNNTGGGTGGGNAGGTSGEIGVPLNRACKEYIEYSTLNVVEKINITLVEV